MFYIFKENIKNNDHQPNDNCAETHEARAEALVLMSVTNNLITPRTGDVLVAATQVASVLLLPPSSFRLSAS